MKKYVPADFINAVEGAVPKWFEHVPVPNKPMNIKDVPVPENLKSKIQELAVLLRPETGGTGITDQVLETLKATQPTIVAEFIRVRHQIYLHRKMQAVNAPPEEGTAKYDTLMQKWTLKDRISRIAQWKIALATEIAEQLNNQSSDSELT